MDPLDLDQFRAPTNDELRPSKPKQPPRHKGGEWFLKGPIPGEWLSAAAKLPGKSLHVGLALWYDAGLTKRRQVKLTGRLLARFGTKPDAGRWALRKLESAGLVTVERKPGCSPNVTIEELEPSENPVAIPARSRINEAGRVSAVTPTRP